MAAGCAPVLLALATAAGCGDVGGAAGPALVAAVSPPDPIDPGNLDILFVIDDSPGMLPMQQKLYDQLPSFFNALGSLPAGLPYLHVGVITADMGAPGDAAAMLGCTTVGNGGELQGALRGACTAGAPEAGATYLSSINGAANFTGSISDALQCIFPLGWNGCPFQQPLAAIARALNADGAVPAILNPDFLRADAALAIVILTNQDDCSAPTMTPLYSLNGGHDNLTNALGPLGHYRCNEFGHLCADALPGGPVNIQPPEMPPSDHGGTATAPTYDLTRCIPNDTGGLLTPVSKLVTEIRALKADPDHRIMVAAIAGPAAPYTVEWLPATGTDIPPTGELWPRIQHACGPASADLNLAAPQVTTDGSFGDPGVRVAQFVQSFGDNGSLASVCDGTYGPALQAFLTNLDDYDGAPSVPSGSGGQSGTGVDGGGGVSGIGGLIGGASGSAGAGGGATGAGGAASGGGGSSGGGLGVDASGRAGNVGLTGDGLVGGGCVACAVGAPGRGAGGLALVAAALALVWRRRRRPEGCHDRMNDRRTVES
ncbi:MAG TPA: MYXO-CTERM sorting domain-containing protein [Polyangia bacterium]|nr:MYXO-CTERM sorting domain-containing protein [Polyangia bacterium]